MTFRAAGLALALALSAGASAQDRPSLDALAARVAEAPDDAQARRALAARYTEAGRPEAAVPHLAWLADSRPADPDVLRQLVQHLLWTDRASEAVPVLDRLVAVDPADDDARVRLAGLLTWDGGAARAVDLLAPIAERRPADPAVQRAFAFALLAAGDDRARRQLDRALGLAPDDATLLLESAAVERWDGDWSLAERRARRALGIGLDADAARRAYALLADIRTLQTPEVTTRITRGDDSNGIERVASPVRVEAVVSSRWAVGVEGTREMISGRDDASARAASYVPFAVWTPARGLRVEGAAGIESSPGDLSPVVRARVQKSWAGEQFALVRLTGETRRATDAATALEAGLRRTTVTAEAYAEPSSALSAFGSVAAHRYSDGNARVQASASGRWLPFRVGTTGPRPAAAIGPTATLVYDDTQTVYPDSRPYYTPSNLWTGSVGLAAALAPTGGVRLDGTLGLARQSGTFAATSLAYGLAVEVEHGRNAVRLEARRSGSSAYAADAVSLSARFRLP
ncbi:tetratricopeptide repeat protein [Rubrivirga sp. IMCC45206]|uniref:tetratricopeptide repeat protein n=1 Tax=Rubrivirga sp. IMCC45206 TaxID=3391614 RepID=UPI00398FFB4F